MFCIGVTSVPGRSRPAKQMAGKLRVTLHSTFSVGHSTFSGGGTERELSRRQIWVEAGEAIKQELLFEKDSSQRITNID